MIYPFRHLDAYEREDIAFYFGREKDIEKLYQMTFETDLLLVYGASGVGKSSLIRCGLANKFGSYEWEDFWIRKKGKNITASLIDELNKKMKDESNKTTIYEQTFEQKRDRIREQIQILLRKHFKPIYLIFDQFEELYTSGNEEEQNEFYEIVKDILSLNQPVKIIISIREEYLGYLYYFEEVIPYLFSHKYWVKPLKLEVEENSVIDKILESVIKNKDESIVSIKDGDKERLAEGIKQMFKNAETSTVDLPSLQILFDEFYFLCGGNSNFTTKVVFSYANLEKKLNENIQDIVWNYLEKWVLGKVKDIKIKTEIVWRFLEKLVSGKGTKEILSEEDLIKYVFGTEEIRQIKALFNQKNDELDPIKQNENGTWELRHDTLAKCINEKLVP
ncbi:MAG: ATP-binding protein, partial [Candidatus Azobacteroides sp.]|nr:ATP-binding protein [Candidatus Azobacteroides sp.]